MEVEMTEIVMPGHANPMGTCFGGTIMSWIDIAAAIAAKRLVGDVVTASVDSIHFEKPIKIGDVVTIRASVNRIWGTSLEVGVTVLTQRSVDGFLERQMKVCRAYLTFVAVTPSGQKRDISDKDLTLRKRADSNLLWKMRYDSAGVRRGNRLNK